MAASANITRRAALIGAIVSSAALAVPMLPAMAAKGSDLDDLIARHNAAYHHLDACVGREMAIDDAADLPKVGARFGWDEVRNEPVLIDSEERISAIASQMASLASAMKADPGYAQRWKVRALFELMESRRTREAAERACGLWDAREARIAAEEWELQARIDLIVCRPTSPAEAERKRAYYASSAPFRENWCIDASEDENARLVRAMMEALSTV